MPRIPNGLLERCLETIPATVITRQHQPRPYLDGRSRWLLAGLSLTAAIPIITVLVVLPLRSKNNTYRSQLIQNSSISNQPWKKLDYVRVESWRPGIVVPQGISSILQFSSQQRVQQVLDRKRGIYYLVRRNTDQDKRAIDGRMSQMMLPSGEQFIVSNTTMGRNHWGKATNWGNVFDENLRELYMGSGFFADGSDIYKPLLRFPGAWKTDPVWIELYSYKPKHMVIDLTVNGYKISSMRIERYISQKTGCVIAERRLLDNHPGTITNVDTARREMQDQRDILYRLDEYFYEPQLGEEQYFNPTKFLKAAKPASS